MTTNRLDAALRYADAGLPVFPCVPGEKRPLVARGLYEATTSADVIRAWWSRCPEANIAMPTGQATYDVVDVDVHAGGSGYAHLNRLHREGLLTGWTHTARTPSGGLHIYFPGTDQRNGKIAAAHVDFRSTGGYVLVPPSIVPQPDGRAGLYRTVATGPGPSSPVNWRAIRDHLAPPPPAPATTGPARGDAPPEKVVQWLAAVVARAQEGNRNDTLFWASCRAAEHGVTDPRPLRDAACHIGLTEREATVTIASAYRTTARTHRARTGRPQEPTSPASSPSVREPAL